MKKAVLLFVLVFAVSVMAQEKPAPLPDSFAKSNQIQVTLTSISLEKYGPMKENKTFKAGETVCINLEMKGLKANDQGQVAIQADIAIPQLRLDRKNLIDGSTAAEEVVPMYFQIPISEVQQPGVCQATITIRDMVAKTSVDFLTEFRLSDDVITYYCGRFRNSVRYEYDKMIKEVPGLEKKMKDNNVVKNNDALIKYTMDNNKSVCVIVPADAVKKYLVPAEKAGAKEGCGISMEKFTAKKLFANEGMDFFRAIVE